MQSLREKEKELRELRRRCGRYGMSRDFAMQRQLADESDERSRLTAARHTLAGCLVQRV